MVLSERTPLRITYMLRYHGDVLAHKTRAMFVLLVYATFFQLFATSLPLLLFAAGAVTNHFHILWLLRSVHSMWCLWYAVAV